MKMDLIQTTGDMDIVCLTIPSEKVGADWKKVGVWSDDFVKLMRYSPSFESGRTMHDYMRMQPRFALNGDKIIDETWYAVAITADVLVHDLLNWMKRNPSGRYEYFDCRNEIGPEHEYSDGGLFGMKIVTDMMDWQLHLWMSVRAAK